MPPKARQYELWQQSFQGSTRLQYTIFVAATCNATGSKARQVMVS
jgi:hypothetical protein